MESVESVVVNLQHDVALKNWIRVPVADPRTPAVGRKRKADILWYVQYTVVQRLRTALKSQSLVACLVLYKAIYR